MYLVVNKSKSTQTQLIIVADNRNIFVHLEMCIFIHDTITIQFLSPQNLIYIRDAFTVLFDFSGVLIWSVCSLWSVYSSKLMDSGEDIHLNIFFYQLSFTDTLALDN